ncbi:thioesterase family protein [Brevibacterium daeguense]|uniref:Thioesterase family protein n=1 Tax=Brevibacterium daeguense TaxID=909936 RepID=A0ABP8EJ02_9MICO|nr:thioesterase family protein [Brevibacterium daeguense]
MTSPYRPPAYFVRTGPTSYRATAATSGAWNTEEQHIAPAIGLLVHLIEADFAQRRGDDLVITQISCDILGTIPVAEMDYQVRVLRPGRTIELVEACLAHGGRTAVLLRAWLLKPGDTAGLAASPLPRIPPPEHHPEWPPAEVWPGGFIASLSCRRIEHEPGRASYWLTTGTPLVDDAQASALARTVGLLDAANGMTVRADPTRVAFPNVDLTAHLFRRPFPGWIGFDTAVSFGGEGTGLTHSTLHDEDGPFGTLAQILTVRPAR